MIATIQKHESKEKKLTYLLHIRETAAPTEKRKQSFLFQANYKTKAMEDAIAIVRWIEEQNDCTVQLKEAIAA